ncbi:MAG: dihydroorotase [Dehalococcoidales bacterium]|nr:dihydroorotase [Dehalococcoidales bacterium]
MNTTKPLLIRDGRIIDPANGIDMIGSILITGDKIGWVGRQVDRVPCSDYRVFDAKEMIVCPGFIDLHCHLRQPGYEEKETIATGSRSAAKGGYTTICCMPNTKPPLDNEKAIGYVKTVARKEGSIRILPIGCITKDRKGKTVTDMTELSHAGAVAFSDDGDSVMNDASLIEALTNSKTLGLPIIEHCENKKLAIDGQINEGKIARKLDLKGIPAEAEESIVRRDIDLAKQTGGKLHIAHTSTAGSVVLIRQAKADGVNITAEVTPHHLTMTEEMALGYNTNAKVNPPLRTIKDIDALIAGLTDGTIDAIATDHAPHTKADKECDFINAAFGISGFETSLGSLMNLLHTGKLSLLDIIAKLTIGPVKVMGKDYGNLGTLTVGKSADITIFDPQISWMVDPDKFISKGKNTPLVGQTLKGKVIASIYGGKVVFKEVGYNIL